MARRNAINDAFSFSGRYRTRNLRALRAEMLTHKHKKCIVGRTKLKLCGGEAELKGYSTESYAEAFPVHSRLH